MTSGVKNAPMRSAIMRNRIVETLSIRGENQSAPILSVEWKRSQNFQSFANSFDIIALFNRLVHI